MPDWWLDESAHIGPEHVDAGYVAGYERKAGFDPSADLEALRALGLDQAAILVDLDAGTGRFALAVSRSCRRVTAVDPSGPMVRHLEFAVERAGVTNIDVVQAGLLSYAHTGPAADFVYTRNALHQLPDAWKALALVRVAQLLKPGGVFFLRDLVYSFDPAEMEQRIESWLSAAASSPREGWTRAELATHVSTEHSTFSWLLEPMLEKAGFEIVQARPSGYPSTYASYSCVKR